MTKKQKINLIRIIVAALLAVGIYFIPLEPLFKLCLFVVPYLLIGYDVLFSAARNIVRGRVFDEKFLMAIATIGAFILTEYPEAVGVMLFYQVGEFFQSLAVGKSRRSIKGLLNLRPDYAVCIRNGEEVKLSPDEVEKGELIIIRAGEKIPLDGEIIEGTTSVNAAALTGESLPINKAVGDKVVSGTLNLSGVIKAKTESVYGESTVSKILELVENSASKKARVESFITRFAKYYTPVVVALALLIALIPPILIGGGFETYLYRALTFLMVSCPCALVVSVPLSFFGAIGGASRRGVLIKGASYIEVLAKINTVVFDKTGTLTRGVFKVNAVHASAINEAKLIDIAAAAESGSNHPLAESIVAAHGKHIDKERIGGLIEYAGMGIEAVIDGKTYYVGNGALMDRAKAKWHSCHLNGTCIHISEGNNYLGHIIISDEIKADSVEAIKSLKAIGIDKTVMLTGDSEAVAKEVALKVAVDDYYAELFPKDKVEKIENLIAQGSKLAFVGDGINDAPVLSRADVGIAMGALGSDAAIEAADVVIMDDKPSKIAYAIKLARKTMRIAKQNVFFALAVKAIILGLSAFGVVGMWLAIFGDVGVMLLAVLNSMRTLKQNSTG